MSHNPPTPKPVTISDERAGYLYAKRLLGRGNKGLAELKRMLALQQKGTEE